MKVVTAALCTLCLVVTMPLSSARHGYAIFGLDERWVCNVKTSCVECLRLNHCSWCQTENTCFSKSLPGYENHCSYDTIDTQDYGFSLELNALCACSGRTSNDEEQNCYPPGVLEGPACSGRGSCVCGRCVCETTPDPKHPTKTIMGEYCEFDNFSCNGPKCNEGPYSLSELRNLDENGYFMDIEQPIE